MTTKEKILRECVKEKFGVSVPQWRKVKHKNGTWDTRVLSLAEKQEKRNLVHWLVNDADFCKLMQIYFNDCATLKARGYGSWSDWQKYEKNRLHTEGDVLRNFACCQIARIYHDMCCDPATILGEGNADGWWIYLDELYLDISSMKIGNAIINLDEIWSTVSNLAEEWHGAMQQRESDMINHKAYKCDRCGNPIYDKSGSRFDIFENLLHCKDCAKECTHWKGKTK